MRYLLLALSWLLLGYVLGFLTQGIYNEERFELLYARSLLLEERVRLQGLLLDRTWMGCVGVEEAHGAGR